jgi:hypothetical protein
MPESGESALLMGSLGDGHVSTGMALGGDQVVASGAAVGALVGAAGFNPLLAAPLALLGAGGGGGGGGGAGTTLPKVNSANLAPEDDTGVSNSDGITKDNTPKLLIDADSTAVSAAVTVNGKTYTSSIKNADGRFVVEIPEAEPLPNGEVKFSVVVKDAAGNTSQPFPGTPFVVDTSSTENYNPAKNPPKENDLNKGLSVQIVSIDADTGVRPGDFVTSDNTLTFRGTVADTFVKNGDFVELQLLDVAGKVVASQYDEPENSGGQWRWEWDNSKQALADGTYTLTALVVDKAGNAVGAGPLEQAITIDTNATPDPNAKFSIAVTALDEDSGSSKVDFLTNERKLSFNGNIGNSNTDFTGMVLVQVAGMDGKVISQSYVAPEQDGTWSYDNTSLPLGVPGANTQYLLNASIVDLAGNILKSTDQSFAVDLQKPTFRIKGLELISGNAALRFEEMTLVAEEAGKFSYSSQVPLVQLTSFVPGTFSINYEDNAGNISTLSNVAPWEFNLAKPIVEIKPTTSLLPSTFGDGELAGSIGTYILGPNEMALDLSTLHSTSPKVGHQVAINHISLSGGGVDNVANADHVLTLTTSDVLALGVKNSFISTSVFKDRQQMRIDGDALDKVLLDDLLGGSTFKWEKADGTIELNPGQKYAVYSNASLGLDLFIQQGIVTTVL